MLQHNLIIVKSNGFSMFRPRKLLSKAHEARCICEMAPCERTRKWLTARVSIVTSIHRPAEPQKHGDKSQMHQAFLSREQRFTANRDHHRHFVFVTYFQRCAPPRLVQTSLYCVSVFDPILPKQGWPVHIRAGERLA